MPTQINVPTAGYAIGTMPDSITTVGVGSCVVICLYSRERKIGALLHCMLPRCEGDSSNPFRCVDTALNQIVVELLHQGVKTSELTAKLVGGAQMFPSIHTQTSIGQQNLDESLRILKAMGIAIAASDTGGNSGRSVVFNLDSGEVSITNSLIDITGKLDTNSHKVL
jgi:chemotaxis protein CheD